MSHTCKNEQDTMFLLLTIMSICVADVQIANVFPNKRLTGKSLGVLNGIGFKSCGRKCSYRESCKGINYYNETLMCILMKDASKMSPTKNNIASMIKDWKIVSMCFNSYV